MKKLKAILKYIFETALKNKMCRDLRRIRPFDIVSMVEEPTPDDLYMVYAVSDSGDVYLVRWINYKTGGVYNADADKQVVYRIHQIPEILYRVVNFKMLPRLVLSCASRAEVMTFLKRMIDVFQSSHLLLGMFTDPNDGHLMMIADRIGDYQTGACDVVDVDNLITYGTMHHHEFLHTISTKYLLDNYTLYPFNIGLFEALFNRPWSNKTMDAFFSIVMEAIRKEEERLYKCTLYGRGLAVCRRPKNESVNTQEKETIK